MRDGPLRLAGEQAALRRVATLVARGASSTDVFDAVATEVASLLDTDITILGRYDGDGLVTAIGSWSASPGGVPVGTRAPVGGRNALTLVAETGLPARVDRYGDATGEASDIARRHGWRSSIAAPVVVDGRLWGVMLVGTQRPVSFPDGAEAQLAAFTDLVATAVGNAQARDELQRVANEQSALRRVATLVAAGPAAEEVFVAVVGEVSRLLGLELIELVRYDEGRIGTVVAASGDHPFPAGTRWSLDDPSVMASVARTGHTARMDGYDELPGEIARVASGAGFRSAVGAPIHVEGRLWGVIIAISTDPEPIPERSQARLGEFTELVATAIANAQSRSALAASRRRIVTAGDEVRRRIGRDLHDGIQQRLLALALLARTASATPPDELPRLTEELADGLAAVAEEVREVAHGIHPTILARSGLGPALRALALRSGVPVDVDVRLENRLPAPIELAAYYVASEALANVAKHAHATTVSLIAAHDDGVLELEVRDDGVGGVDIAQGSGIVGLIDRVEALGGTIEIVSESGAGTALSMRLPTRDGPVG
jgi:signal transduction histidine kinase